MLGYYFLAQFQLNYRNQPLYYFYQLFALFPRNTIFPILKNLGHDPRRANFPILLPFPSSLSPSLFPLIPYIPNIRAVEIGHSIATAIARITSKIQPCHEWVLDTFFPDRG